MKQFPDINEIKLLEKNSQKNGSGILYEELLGIWTVSYTHLTLPTNTTV